MALQFDVEIFPKEVEPPAEFLLRLFFFTVQYGLRYLRSDAAAGGYQPLVMFFDQLLIDAWEFGVQALDKTQGTELGQVLIPFLVFGQQQLVVAIIFFTLSAGKRFLVPVVHQVKFTANNGFEVAAFGLRHKLKSAEHITVVGQGDAFLPIAGSLVHHSADLCGSVQQRILSVAMQVYELWH